LDIWFPIIIDGVPRFQDSNRSAQLFGGVGLRVACGSFFVDSGFAALDLPNFSKPAGAFKSLNWEND
jgi:hypothetical protein